MQDKKTYLAFKSASFYHIPTLGETLLVKGLEGIFQMVRRFLNRALERMEEADEGKLAGEGLSDIARPQPGQVKRQLDV